jgi:hypothetical protein
MIKPVTILLVVAVLLIACNSNNKKKGNSILKKEKMEAVLWDVLRADAFVFTFVTKDSLKRPEAEMAALQQKIFAVHKTNRQQFNSSMDYYRAHPDVFLPMLDSMINRYTRDKYATTKSGTVPKIADTTTIKTAQ